MSIKFHCYNMFEISLHKLILKILMEKKICYKVSSKNITNIVF